VRRPVEQLNGERERTITLRDGRRLGYAEWGDPGGHPVLYFHGTPSSRLDPVLFADAPGAVGVRLLSLDRPGIGLSSFKRDRRVADWADDVAEFADALALNRFGVVGWSGGGPYVLACAARLADRLTGASVAAGMGAMDRPGAVKELSWMDRAIYRLSLRAPAGARLLYGAIIALSRRAPEQARQSLRADLPEQEQQVLDGLSDEAKSMGWFVEAGRAGTRGPVEDYRAHSDWGFALGQVTMPVGLWHGDVDKLVPIPAAQDIAARAPGATLHQCPGAGHLVMVTRAEELLRSAAGGLS
jgi:pimeloyl-ACP methyl ester carboxylesterase